MMPFVADELGALSAGCIANSLSTILALGLASSRLDNPDLLIAQSQHGRLLKPG